MIPVPKMTIADISFGNIKYLPKNEDIPNEFKLDSNKANKMASDWFFGLLNKETMPKTKEGLNKFEVLGAIRAILVSFEPSHEHKIAGVAYLINEWFEL